MSEVPLPPPDTITRVEMDAPVLEEALPFVDSLETKSYKDGLSILNLSEGLVGGEKKGGKTLIDLKTIAAISSKEDGFKINGQEADLMTVLKIGNQKIGVVDLYREKGYEKGFNNDEFRFALTYLEEVVDKSGKTTYKAVKNQNGYALAALINNPSLNTDLGRHSSSILNENSLGDKAQSDDYISSKHASLKFTDDGVLVISDRKSTNGTDIIFKEGIEKQKNRKVTLSAGFIALQGLGMGDEKGAKATRITRFSWENPGNLGIAEHNIPLQEEAARRMQEHGYPQEALDLVMTGKARGKDIDSINVGLTRNAGNIMGIRQTIAELMSNNPDVANLLIDNEIVGFHGTRSSALADMLSAGALLSASEAKRRGIKHLTGEHIWQRPEGQNSISFTTLEDVGNAMQYAGGDNREMTLDEVINKLKWEKQETIELSNESGRGERLKEVLDVRVRETDDSIKFLEGNPDSILAEMLKANFPVLVGIGVEDVYAGRENRKQRWRPLDGTTSGYNEFRAAGESIDLDKTVIAVPKDKIARVKELLKASGKTNTVVIEIEALNTKKQ